MDKLPINWLFHQQYHPPVYQGHICSHGATPCSSATCDLPRSNVCWENFAGDLNILLFKQTCCHRPNEQQSLNAQGCLSILHIHVKLYIESYIHVLYCRRYQKSHIPFGSIRSLITKKSVWTFEVGMDQSVEHCLGEILPTWMGPWGSNLRIFEHCCVCWVTPKRGIKQLEVAWDWHMMADNVFVCLLKFGNLSENSCGNTCHCSRYYCNVNVIQDVGQWI